ncbi:MAG TPA: hypothetical protein VHD90_25970 [Phototrophicaceae bacterium]|nr:hypothetical protein [Phototrophicaceae bacterium]
MDTLVSSLISKETVATLVQIGGQYLLPVAALLRALYAGIRGKFPEGILQIAVASLFAGLTAVVGDQQPDLRSIILGILGNTVFTAGLLAFIFAYLLRMTFRSKIVDGIVGGFVGLAAWLFWVYILGNNLDWWTIPLAIIGVGLAFIVLRVLLRNIGRLVKIATYFIIFGLLFVLGAGGVLVLTGLLQAPKIPTLP